MPAKVRGTIRKPRLRLSSHIPWPHSILGRYLSVPLVLDSVDEGVRTLWSSGVRCGFSRSGHPPDDHCPLGTHLMITVHCALGVSKTRLVIHTLSPIDLGRIAVWNALACAYFLSILPQPRTGSSYHRTGVYRVGSALCPSPELRATTSELSMSPSQQDLLLLPFKNPPCRLPRH